MSFSDGGNILVNYEVNKNHLKLDSLGIYKNIKK